ncbi:hypothetical protein [Massilia sp.]|uniref:hypothetical protein n=1 Tax=Massilia sp. TaxID=1882437 RepID=UPI00289CB94F|nr:hypothetical protein [Massilia sp.]
MGIRLVVAVPHDSYIRPGVGDLLTLRIAPHYPATPIMLINDDASLAYATFETAKILKALDISVIDFELIDLDTPVIDDVDAPF